MSSNFTKNSGLQYSGLAYENLIDPAPPQIPVASDLDPIESTILRRFNDPSENLPSEEDVDDLLDRFTDPLKKENKKRRREEAIEQKCQKIRMSGKELACDRFNILPTADEVKILAANIIKTLDLNYIQAELQSVTSNEVIGYTPKNHKPVGLEAVLEFIICSAHCQQWLTTKLQSLGVKSNITNYNPVAVSHSASEVLEATLECYRMACKQLIRYIEYTVNQADC